MEGEEKGGGFGVELYGYRFTTVGFNIMSMTYSWKKNVNCASTSIVQFFIYILSRSLKGSSDTKYNGSGFFINFLKPFLVNFNESFTSVRY